jgi:hypothetical protein
MLPDPQALLAELHRILAPSGRLSVKPDHMSEESLLTAVGATDLFSLHAECGGTYDFRKNGQTETH